MEIKLADILKGVKIGTGIGKVFLPGVAGTVLDQINKGIADPSDPINEGSLKHLASVDEQIIAILTQFEARLQKLEQKK
jgi:hypothetical protein